MSHWNQYSLEVLNNVEMKKFEAAVADMGLSLDHTVKEVTNAYGRSKVDAGLKKGTSKLSLGIQFKKVDGKLKATLQGDFYGTGVSEYGFMSNLAKHYQKHVALETLPAYGYTVESCELNAETNQIEVLAYQYA